MKQTERVLEYLRKNYAITAKQAMDELGIYRLGARMWDLKKQGYPVQSCFITVKNRFGEECRVKAYNITGIPEGYPTPAWMEGRNDKA